MRFITSLFQNSMIGPFIVVSIFLAVGLSYFVPKLSSLYLKEQSIEQAEVLVDHIRTFRSYYNKNVLGKIRKETDLNINYDHKEKSNTLPLPATLVHDLGSIFTENSNVGVQMYSDFPFPNRASRTLDGFQKRSLAYLLQHPGEIYTEYDEKKLTYRSAFPDYLVAEGCVSCHNTRKDTPKNDWKLGDMRGVIEVSTPISNSMAHNKQLSFYIIGFVGFNILLLIIYYSILAYKKSKKLETDNTELEEKVELRTKEIINKNKILSEYKKAVDEGAIVSKSDTSGIITYANEAFEKISGFTADELIGKSHNIVRHPDTPKKVFEELWNTISNKKVWRGELKNKAKDGSCYYVSVTISPLLDENDEIIEYIAIRFDTSNLHEAVISAQAAERAKGKFLANMSHELRTPLNAIIGFAQILIRKYGTKSPEVKYFEKILVSGQNLLRLVDTILDFSKVDEGKMEYSPTSFKLSEILSETSILIEPQINDKHLELIIPSEDDLDTTMYADFHLLKQVFVNLLSNAIKFTSETGKITISYSKADGYHKLSVCDTGKGIPPEDLENLFDPFNQGSDFTQREQGTGLGLTLAKRIIEDLHKGSMSVESTVGKGSCFNFSIPEISK